jgi:hypothetical protein
VELVKVVGDLPEQGFADHRALATNLQRVDP